MAFFGMQVTVSALFSTERRTNFLNTSPAEPSVDLDLEYIENVFTYLESWCLLQNLGVTSCHH